MSRRLNFTGRKKLTRASIKIRMHETKLGQPASFSADVNIPGDFRLSPQGRVYVEAYVGASAMRFDFGTVAAVTQPVECLLSEIDAGTPVLFRVKVVDESEHIGRLLAAAHGIRPEGDDDGADRKALLPLRGCDLGEEVWHLEFDKDAGPTLAINNRVPGLVERFPSDATLMAAIYPEVVRQMAMRVWSGNSGFDEGADWLSDWTKWLIEQLGREVSADELDDSDSVEVLANDVARNFAAKHKYASAMALLTGEVEP